MRETNVRETNAATFAAALLSQRYVFLLAGDISFSLSFFTLFSPERLFS
jgi:hypothetical protein